MKIHQGAILSRDPNVDMEAATKRYVDSKITSAGVGLFITNVTPTASGLVGTKVYVAGTVPADAVISEATSDTQAVRVTFFAEGGATFYSPTVTVDTDPGPGVAGIITEHSTDKRSYTGYADVIVTADREITVTADTGASASVMVHRAAAAPDVQSMVIGSYPGSQTAAKQNDVMTVTGTVANTASLVELIGGTGAVKAGTYTTATTGGTLGATDSGGAGFRSFTIQFSVSGLSGSQTATAKAKNAFGSYGSNFASTNSITLDQVFPTIGSFTVTYPASQSALKGSETASITSTVLNYTSVSYTSSADLSVANPTTYASPKVVTRVGGTYSYGVNNYTITADKASNGSQTVSSTSVAIANVAPTVAFSITGSPTRLISSAVGQAYTVNLVANQRLLNAPTVTATSGTLTAFTGSGTTWTATLTVDDTDPVGAHSFAVTSITNLANTNYTSVTTTGQNYTVGGFVTRDVTVGALERVVDLGVMITDPTKVTVKYTGTTDNLTYRATDLTLFVKGWSKVDGTALVFTAGTEPFQNYTNFVYTAGATSWLYLTDSDFAGANTTGTLQVTIGEAA
jgi:hypothetical protein